MIEAGLGIMGAAVTVALLIALGSTSRRVDWHLIAAGVLFLIGMTILLAPLIR